MAVRTHTEQVAGPGEQCRPTPSPAQSPPTPPASQLNDSARLPTLKNNAMTFPRSSLRMRVPLEEFVVFKSNYAARRKQGRISYINTFKDIFLIILFFSDNILQRNLINTLRETWVQHANVQGACAQPAAAPSRSPGGRAQLESQQVGAGPNPERRKTPRVQW